MSDASQAAPVLDQTNAAGKSVLKAEGLSRAFVDGERRLDVLKNVDIALQAGEVAALVGRSGSGKSTLLHLLGLLDQPSAGEILIDGTPAGSLSETDRSFIRNRQIGFVFQHYFLLPEFTVLENILMPAKIAYSAAQWGTHKDEMHAQARQLLESVGMQANTAQFPRTLSGGERQRVAVARALLLRPKILLCDEPTGNLDPQTGTHIINLIFELSRKQNTAALVVTHDSAIAARADRVYRLEQAALVREK